VLERVMLDFMYELPSDEEVSALTVELQHVLDHFPKAAKPSKPSVA
jgi:ATP-dependent protease Clp ATPase subunit